jgi:FMN reductase
VGFEMASLGSLGRTCLAWNLWVCVILLDSGLMELAASERASVNSGAERRCDMLGPLVIGIGGTPRAESSTELALKIALEAAKSAGARTDFFGGRYLAKLPMYLTDESLSAGHELIEAVRRADGLIIASPGYHGSISGAVKNAIDYLETTSQDTRVYLDGLPVGLIVTAYGWQATGSTLSAMRSVVHALRGWPTPMGATINTNANNTNGKIFDKGSCVDPGAQNQLALVGQQVAMFATRRAISG